MFSTAFPFRPDVAAPPPPGDAPHHIENGRPGLTSIQALLPFSCGSHASRLRISRPLRGACRQSHSASQAIPADDVDVPHGRAAHVWTSPPRNNPHVKFIT